jgi:Na+(H+)/acetate symporter ActP
MVQQTWDAYDTTGFQSIASKFQSAVIVGSVALHWYWRLVYNWTTANDASANDGHVTSNELTSIYDAFRADYLSSASLLNAEGTALQHGFDNWSPVSRDDHAASKKVSV